MKEKKLKNLHSVYMGRLGGLNSAHAKGHLSDHDYKVKSNRVKKDWFWYCNMYDKHVADKDLYR
jgi:hypothetical protein